MLTGHFVCRPPPPQGYLREPAPLLTNAGTTLGVAAAYRAWQEHHYGCPTCGRQDWYMPGGVRLDVEPLLADGHLTIEGKVVYFRHAPDLTVLCPTGRPLFRQWVDAAARLTWTTTGT